MSTEPSAAPTKAALKALAKTLAPWQPPVVDGMRDKRGSAGRAGVPSMKDFNPSATPFSSGDKARDKAVVEELATDLDVLQNLFFADKRHKLLVILQGTDTSGKDGTLRGVFGRISPLGVRTFGWKAPTEEERAHDFLWRIHQKLPGAGEVMIFNRSHYEDVLVPPVNGWISPAQTARRYQHINDFERMLCDTGTVVLKFMLHISFDEQRARLQERIDDPTKHWKFSAGDIEVRKQWKLYQRAYASLLQATSTPWAPWTVVPSDSKTHRNLMIATVVRATLQQLGLRYPPGDPALAGVTVT
ncbi:MAG: polyphosphate--nucleotide phosphotransferase [Polaromonas sp. 39-63-203]|jgi:PPK2 family polyphosphate:nucleotide phosphotransferase|uniref:PPK2 family polyphosphate kinase n=1 Tax=Polaromonas sp. TaxID=1869339 RepID=UPI000BCB50A1|nr:PPK2 family polyphosphate kinase [Polaromonas sp.]OYY53505.1 MAG: polyphosphate--nucleotide phosphotransferase [Polaromonas sp. 35-63-240]OYZ00815.1 MAG: polyphosphate--nucleotide phosphotransferase [Polaromonas sp. 28-63-22]OYZ84545.1 MAG: polyphosphate--nucleotide phosphotransferase [Polaromonas sp. 24-62-144]OZB00455.1 MAG: polyphosphate--nucleotide phosphotransferase [Polaromonas sp. 39-63-203]HQS31025.1 polyphosphate--nucleotide phosphotransferase [Polaromonas sp.]